MERCCIAQRPASVSRVITTVETPHNTERQRERGRRGERKREEKEEEKYIDVADKLLLFLRIIYHPGERQSTVNVSYCLLLK